MNYSYYFQPNQYVYYVPNVVPTTTQSYRVQTVPQISYQHPVSYRNVYIPPVSAKPVVHEQPVNIEPAKKNFLYRIFSYPVKNATIPVKNDKTEIPINNQPKVLPSAPPMPQVFDNHNQQNLHSYSDPKKYSTVSNDDYLAKKPSRLINDHELKVNSTKNYYFNDKLDQRSNYSKEDSASLTKPPSSPKRVRFSKYYTISDTDRNRNEYVHERDLQSNLNIRKSSSLNDIRPIKATSNESLESKSSQSQNGLRFDKYASLNDSISRSRTNFTSEQDLRIDRNDFSSNRNIFRRSISQNELNDHHYKNDYLNESNSRLADIDNNSRRVSRNYYENIDDYDDYEYRQEPITRKSNQTNVNNIPAGNSLPRPVLLPHRIDNHCPCCNKPNASPRVFKDVSFISDLKNSLCSFKIGLKRRLFQRLEHNAPLTKSTYMMPI